MTVTLSVRPAAGRRVLHPVTHQPLGRAWVRLPRDAWLIRRLADGDLQQRPGEPATAPSAREEGDE